MFYINSDAIYAIKEQTPGKLPGVTIFTKSMLQTNDTPRCRYQ
jgi:hypothetical protein